MRVGAKGQVTIPKALRDHAGIEAGSEVEFGVDGDTITLKRAARRERPGLTRGERVVAALAEPPRRTGICRPTKSCSFCVAMTDTLVDTNVLLDVAEEDPDWLAWSQYRMTAAADQGSLVVNQVIYSELARRLRDRGGARCHPRSTRFRRENIPWDAAFMAGLAFLSYRSPRRHPHFAARPISLIGAHAAVPRLPDCSPAIAATTTPISRRLRSSPPGHRPMIGKLPRHHRLPMARTG